MSASANALLPATRKAREDVKSSIWLIIGLSTLSPVPTMYTGFLGKSFARSALVRMSAPPPSVTRQQKRIGDHARLQDIGDRDRFLEGRAGVPGRPLTLHHGNHRKLL